MCIVRCTVFTATPTPPPLHGCVPVLSVESFLSPQSQALSSRHSSAQESTSSFHDSLADKKCLSISPSFCYDLPSLEAPCPASQLKIESIHRLEREADVNRLRTYCRQGLPDSLRTQLWVMMTQVPRPAACSRWGLSRTGPGLC